MQWKPMSNDPPPVGTWLGTKSVDSGLYSASKAATMAALSSTARLGGIDISDVLRNIGTKWIVIGDDTRLPVSAVRPDSTPVTTAWTKSGLLNGCVAYIEAETPVAIKRGTGVFIHPLAVLTAAHCLGGGRYGAASATLYPGLNVGRRGGRFMAYDSVVSSDFEMALDWDLAVIRLSAPVQGLPDNAGHRQPMTLVPPGDDQIDLTAGFSVGVVGYPAPSGPLHQVEIKEFGQYEASGEVLGVSGWELRHNVDTWSRQSGSPILALFPQGTSNPPPYRIIGIHQGGVPGPTEGTGYNYGVRFTPEITAWILSCIP